MFGMKSSKAASAASETVKGMFSNQSPIAVERPTNAISDNLPNSQYRSCCPVRQRTSLPRCSALGGMSFKIPRRYRAGSIAKYSPRKRTMTMPPRAEPKVENAPRRWREARLYQSPPLRTLSKKLAGPLTLVN